MAFGKITHINFLGKAALLFAALGIVILFAFICEYITNDAKNIRDADRKIVPIEELDAQYNGFSYNNNGELTSEEAGALIAIQNVKGNVLHIQLEDKTFSQPIVMAGGKQIEAAMSGPQPMHYSNYFSYDIHRVDGGISVTIQEEGTTIKEIEIDNRYHFNQYKFVYSLLLGCCIMFFCIVLLYKYSNVEVIFIVCSMTLTLMMSIMLPLSTTNTLDEEIHYARQASFLEKNVTQYDNDAPLVKQGRNCSLIPITCVGRSRNLLPRRRSRRKRIRRKDSMWKTSDSSRLLSLSRWAA